MISVCMATYNGGRYIKEQLASILSQLSDGDEVIISDDSSTDGTIDIINSFRDKRIRLFPNQKFHSPIFNFENALKHANGEYIFLSDQDDIWEPNKVERSMRSLFQYSLVVSDCSIVDKDGKLIKDSFGTEGEKKGIIRNLVHNNYLGCCMAFRKEILQIALPFPPKIAMHDIWLGLCANVFYSTCFIPDRLIRYRRHGDNVSHTSERSLLPLSYRISYRMYFAFQILKRFVILRMK